MSDHRNSNLIKRGVRWLLITELFAAGLAAFAVISFVCIGQWQKEYERKIALIQEHKIEPEKLAVVRRWYQDDMESYVHYIIYSGSRENEIYVKVTPEYYDSPKALQPVTGYWIERQYVIPELQGNWDYKWAYLAWPGCLSLLLFGFAEYYLREPKPSNQISSDV